MHKGARMGKKRILVTAATVGLLLVIVVGLSSAQEPDPEGISAQGELSVTSMVDSTISYQGMLTDDNNPVTGSRTMIFRLYSDSGCTTQVGADINAGSVQVSEGYFDVDLPVDHDDFNGQALWVEVEVSGTDVGCEPIRPVPYALSLKPQATINGTAEVGGALLSANVGDSLSGGFGQNMLLGGAGVYGTADVGVLLGAGVYGVSEGTGSLSYGVWGESTAASGRGVYGHGTSSSGVNYGVYGETDSPSGYGGYFTNDDGVALMADGSGVIKSAADTTIAANPLNMVPYYDSAADLDLRFAAGTVTIRPNSAGYQYVYVPVDVPTLLFGSPTKLKSARICYNCDSSADAIIWTGVRYQGDSAANDLVSDGTDRNSTSWECYTLTDGTPEQIQGSLLLRLNLNFDGTGASHDIEIGKITVTLTES